MATRRGPKSTTPTPRHRRASHERDPLPWREELTQALREALKVIGPDDSVRLGVRHALSLLDLIHRDAARDRIEERARDALNPQGRFAAQFAKEHRTKEHPKGKPPSHAQRATEALRILEISGPFFKPIARPEVFLFAELIATGADPWAALEAVAKECGFASLESARTILQHQRAPLRELIESYGEGAIAERMTAPMRALLAALAKLPGGP